VLRRSMTCLICSFVHGADNCTVLVENGKAEVWTGTQAPHDHAIGGQGRRLSKAT